MAQSTKEHTVVGTDVGGADENENSIFSDYKYRYRYYSISAPFIELVGEKAYNSWFYKEYYPIPIEERNEMAIVTFIKEFNISREDFDRANLIHNKNASSSQSDIITDVSQYKPGYDRAIECNETYNADIIYTFDNELINAYYLYVDPYEDEGSTVGDGVLDVPNDETTSEPVSETSPAEIETNITEIPTEIATTEETTAN